MGAHLPAGAPRQLMLLAIKVVLSVVVPALLIRALRPERSWSAVVGAVREGQVNRRPGLALVIAVLFFALL